MSCSLPSTASSSVPASSSEATCLRGQIRMCVRACGPMSSNAKTSSSSYTILDGIFLAAILQNRQSALIHPSCAGAFIQAHDHRREAFAVAKLLAELSRGIFSRNFADPHAVEQAVRRIVCLNENRRVRSIQPLAQSLRVAAITKGPDLHGEKSRGRFDARRKNFQAHRHHAGAD